MVSLVVQKHELVDWVDKKEGWWLWICGYWGPVALFLTCCVKTWPNLTILLLLNSNNMKFRTPKCEICEVTYTVESVIRALYIFHLNEFRLRLCWYKVVRRKLWLYFILYSTRPGTLLYWLEFFQSSVTFWQSAIATSETPITCYALKHSYSEELFKVETVWSRTTIVLPFTLTAYIMLIKWYI